MNHLMTARLQLQPGELGVCPGFSKICENIMEHVDLGIIIPPLQDPKQHG